MPAALRAHRNKYRLPVHCLLHKSGKQVKGHTAGNQQFKKR